MRDDPDAPDAAEVLDRYWRAFEGFSEEELLLLDGVVLSEEPEG